MTKISVALVHYQSNFFLKQTETAEDIQNLVKKQRINDCGAFIPNLCIYNIFLMSRVHRKSWKRGKKD